MYNPAVVMTERKPHWNRLFATLLKQNGIIAEQRQRIEKLKATGISSLYAQQTLDVFITTLKLLEDHEQYLRKHILK